MTITKSYYHQMNWIEKCNLIGNMYRIAKEELSNPSGIIWSNLRNKEQTYTLSPSLQTHSNMKKMSRLTQSPTIQEKMKTKTNVRKNVMTMTTTKKRWKQKKKKMMMESSPLGMVTLTEKENTTNLKNIIKTSPPLPPPCPVTTASVLPASFENLTAMTMTRTTMKSSYNNPIIDLYMKHMNSLRNMAPSNHHDIKVLIYDQWNAAVRCDKLFIRMVILGGVLTVYEPEMGISLRRASCRDKFLARTFDPVKGIWESGCFPSFLDIEKSLTRRSDVIKLGLSLSEVKDKNIVGVINHLSGKEDSQKKVLSIWSKTGERPSLINPTGGGGVLR
uniref:Wsv134-like protein n=1 Tax=Marsupenaeus japonicus endogenous nimavirus TaxID=2133793 RepID=A0A401IP72_9VIRU|nr:wsv134-like protein [Marsupenaeus japonicus endogenous nimavirus]